MLYAHQQKPELALKDLEKALEIAPGSHTMNTKAFVHGMLEQYDQAVEASQEAIRLAYKEHVTHGELAELRNTLAMWQRTSGDNQAAVETVTLALDGHPTDFTRTRLLYERGCAYAELGKDEKALEDLSQVLELRPRMAIAWIEKARVLEKLGRREEAVEAYRQCAETAEEGAGYGKTAREKLEELSK